MSYSRVLVEKKYLMFTLLLPDLALTLIQA